MDAESKSHDVMEKGNVTRATTDIEASHHHYHHQAADLPTSSSNTHPFILRIMRVLSYFSISYGVMAFCDIINLSYIFTNRPMPYAVLLIRFGTISLDGVFESMLMGWDFTCSNAQQQKGMHSRLARPMLESRPSSFLSGIAKVGRRMFHDKSEKMMK